MVVEIKRNDIQKAEQVGSIESNWVFDVIERDGSLAVGVETIMDTDSFVDIKDIIITTGDTDVANSKAEFLYKDIDGNQVSISNHTGNGFMTDNAPIPSWVERYPHIFTRYQYDTNRNTIHIDCKDKFIFPYGFVLRIENSDTAAFNLSCQIDYIDKGVIS